MPDTTQQHTLYKYSTTRAKHESNSQNRPPATSACCLQNLAPKRCKTQPPPETSTFLQGMFEVLPHGRALCGARFPSSILATHILCNDVNWYIAFRKCSFEFLGTCYLCCGLSFITLLLELCVLMWTKMHSKVKPKNVPYRPLKTGLGPTKSCAD